MGEQPNVLRIGDRVVLGGEACAVVALSGTAVRLLSGTGRSTVVALPYLIAAPGFEIAGAAPPVTMPAHGLLEALPQHVPQAARAWERHLVELETGLAPDAPPDAVPRPEYDPLARSLAQREHAKAAELRVTGRATWSLPITVRPMYGETVVSCTWRLSQANDLQPLTILRALGQSHRPPHKGDFVREALFNAAAVQRLEIYSGISRSRLRTALPGLGSSREGLRDDTPAIWIHHPWPHARPACTR